MATNLLPNHDLLLPLSYPLINILHMEHEMLVKWQENDDVRGKKTSKKNKKTFQHILIRTACLLCIKVSLGIS